MGDMMGRMLDAVVAKDAGECSVHSLGPDSGEEPPKPSKPQPRRQQKASDPFDWDRPDTSAAHPTEPPESAALKPAKKPQKHDNAFARGSPEGEKQKSRKPEPSVKPKQKDRQAKPPESILGDKSDDTHKRKARKAKPPEDEWAQDSGDGQKARPPEAGPGGGRKAQNATPSAADWAKERQDEAPVWRPSEDFASVSSGGQQRQINPAAGWRPSRQDDAMPRADRHSADSMDELLADDLTPEPKPAPPPPPKAPAIHPSVGEALALFQKKPPAQPQRQQPMTQDRSSEDSEDAPKKRGGRRFGQAARRGKQQRGSRQRPR
jgi:hypothetical protein